MPSRLEFIPPLLAVVVDMFRIVVLGFGIVCLFQNVMVLFLVYYNWCLSLIAVSAISSVLNAIFKIGVV